MKYKKEYKNQIKDSILVNKYISLEYGGHSKEIICKVASILGDSFTPKYLKTGVAFYGITGNRILKLVNRKKCLEIEFNVPVANSKNLVILTDDQAKEMKMGTCRWIYNGDILPIDLIEEAKQKYMGEACDESYNTKIDGLSKLFYNYRIYPKNSYKNSFIVHFINTHPENNYSNDIIRFLGSHDYQQDKIGSDLPWWGKHYFSSKSGVRTLILAQDSNSPDAGSVTFYANLMQLMNKEQYKSYISKFQRFDGWILVKELFELSGLDMDFVYITDARKVYPNESFKYKNSDSDSEETRQEKAKSRKGLLTNKDNFLINKELLELEIQYCKPDVIIILGNSGLNLIDPTVKLTNVLDGDCTIWLYDRQYFIAPFPSGASSIYEKYKHKSAQIIKSKINAEKGKPIDLVVNDKEQEPRGFGIETTLKTTRNIVSSLIISLLLIIVILTIISKS